MVMASASLREDYWQSFNLLDEDIEFIYNYLLDLETPLTPDELVRVLVNERIRREADKLEKQRRAGGELYYPQEKYLVGAKLVFPALGWQPGVVVDVRVGRNPDVEPFDVIQVELQSGDVREFAAGFGDHPLNDPPEVAHEDDSMNPAIVLEQFGDELMDALEDGLSSNSDFVRIAGRWFPLALLVDINTGHLNLAEAVLDMAGGGPLRTDQILEQIEMHSSENPKLVEFSFDYALENDDRFDEVGPAGQVLWYLRRLEPAEVRTTPIYLRYEQVDYDRTVLTNELLDLERELDDELSRLSYMPEGRPREQEVEVRLIFPHWHSGTLPLSARVRQIFPTAYEAPRVRFMLVDGETGEQFPGWVVLKERYVYGLKEWYQARGLTPGSLVKVSRGKRPGEVIVQAGAKRSSRDWMRTVLVGVDSGIVFAMLRQVVQAEYDERMAIAIPDVDNLEKLWLRSEKSSHPLERVVVNMVRELTKLNPQSHVHVSELYAAVNLVRRCPPGPILSLLASRPWFVHVGDFHFRFDDSERA